jgi:arylsulfatase
MEGSLRVPFIIRWLGKVPAGHVSNEIVHIVDMFTTLARVGGAEVPKDRPIDGVDQLDFFLGKQENSNREGFHRCVANLTLNPSLTITALAERAMAFVPRAGTDQASA